MPACVRAACQSRCARLGCLSTNPRTESHIFEFDLDEVTSVFQRDTLEAANVSTGVFYANYENGFVVTDAKTQIFAVDCENHKFLMYEDLAGGEAPNCFGAHEGSINTVVATSDNRSLLVGDSKGVVVQYSLKDRVGSIEHIYESLGIHRVFSSATFGDLAVFGGNNSRIRVLNPALREQLEKPVSSAVRFITSAQICRVRNLVMVALAGQRPQKPTGGTDLMDITEMYSEQDRQDWQAEEPGSDDSRVWDAEYRDASPSEGEDEGGQGLSSASGSDR